MERVLGQNEGVLGCNTHEAFSVPRLIVGVSNEVQMIRNLTGGLPVVNQGRLASVSPIRKYSIPTHERKLEMTTGGERSAGMQNGQRGKWSNAWDEHVCKCNAHDDMIWDAWHASNDNTTTANNCTTPGTSVSGRYNTPPLREDLVPRSRMAPEGQRKR